MGPLAELMKTAIRPFRAEDAPALTRILQDSPEAAQWTEESRRELLTSPGVFMLVIELQGAVSGFIVGRQVADEAEVLNLAVAPEFRRRGEGASLLKSVLAEFRGRGARRAFLEVRESNSNAIAFYERQGFSKVGRRPDYYSNPEEAAIVMERKLGG